MKTEHRVVVEDSRTMGQLTDASVDLVVTSPPYPMIEMWDGMYSLLSPAVAEYLVAKDGNGAFEAMHVELDKVWRQVYRVLKPGGFACVNIGDATRTMGGAFQLYPNHSRVISAFRALGFNSLPVVLWRKQTNAPNKFMGSGMLPAGAYVTLEHEFILIFRKGAKRQFSSSEQKMGRMRSSFFWEERNRWFSDVWDFKGTSQRLSHSDLRSRSASYPLELPYRLINMFSLYGDTVLDPFVGKGTTMLASVACGRNSVGFEIDDAFPGLIMDQAARFSVAANDILWTRISDHVHFVTSRQESKKPPKHLNVPHGFAVVTRQETEIQLYRVAETEVAPGQELTVNASYEPVGRLDDSRGISKVQAILHQVRGRQLTLGF